MGDSERKVINVNSDLLAHTLRNLTKRRTQSDGVKTKRATTSPGIMLKPDIKNKRALLNATRKFRQQRQQQMQSQNNAMMMANAAKSAKDLAGADTSGDNALTRMMGMSGGQQ